VKSAGLRQERHSTIKTVYKTLRTMTVNIKQATCARV